MWLGAINRSVTISVPIIQTASLPHGVVGTTYSQQLLGVNGNPPYIWSMPPVNGLSLSSGGLLSGTPINAETDNLTVSMSDTSGVVAVPRNLQLVTTASGATTVFNFAGFAGAGSTLKVNGNGAAIVGSTLKLSQTSAGQHQSGSAFYTTKQPTGAFTTNFTFSTNTPAPAFGMFFMVQNTNPTNMPNPIFPGGVTANADANGEGYGAYNLTQQWPIVASVGIKFDGSACNGNSYVGPIPSSTGLYMNGGPPMGNNLPNGFMVEEDLTSAGINIWSGHTMAVNIVYDTSNMVMVLKDTTTGNQVRKIWPVNTATCTNSTTAWVGFGSGTVTAADWDVFTWDYSTGFNTRLAAPTISPPAGVYASAQTCTLSGPAGASIYYTENGQLPTTGSTLYSGPFTVSATEYVQAIAVQSGFTDSYPAAALYNIGASTNPINFPSGFTGAGNLISLNGTGVFNGSNIKLTDVTLHSPDLGDTGAAWFVSPVNISGASGGWTTSFTISWGSPSQADGLCFVIHNYLPASQDTLGNLTSFAPFTGNLVVGGGANSLSFSNAAKGYQGIPASIAVAFGLYSGTNEQNTVGLYTNGQSPGGSQIATGLTFSGNSFNVTLTYSGTTLSITMQNVTGGTIFSHSWTVDIPAITFGSTYNNTAYVGFTASRSFASGTSALQQITKWTMT